MSQDKPGLSNEELKPEVQAALSGGRDDRWEKLREWLMEIRDNSGLQGFARVAKRILEKMTELESMSAKEGE